MNFLSIVAVNGFLLYTVVRYFPEFGLNIQVPSVLLGYFILGVVFWFFYELVLRIIKAFAFPLAFLTMGFSTIVINVLVFYMFAYVSNVYVAQQYTGISVALGTVWQTFLLSLILFFIMRIVHFIINKII